MVVQAKRLHQEQTQGHPISPQSKTVHDREMQAFRRDLDRYFTLVDIRQAVALIQQFREQHPQSNLHSHEKPNLPAKDSQLAASVILQQTPPMFARLDMTTEELQALRFQAAEVVLADSPFFDRLASISRQLHPNGNVWLVKYFCAYGKKRAATITEGRSHNNGRSVVGLATPAKPIEPNPLISGVRPSFITALPRVWIPVGIKITVPYVILAVLLAAAGTYLGRQVILNTLDERLTNQLIEVGKLSSDRMVVEETQRLATLRLLANMEDMPAAIVSGDTERLRNLALPVAINNHEEAIEIVNRQGQAVLSMRHQDGQAVERYQFTQGDTIFGLWLFVQNALQRRLDQGRDKYADVMDAPWGRYFYIAGPVIDPTGDVVGAILVGKSLNSLTTQFRQETLAHTTFYGLDGRPVASSHFLIDAKDINLGSEQINSVFNRLDNESLIRDITIGSINYREILSSWEVRDGEDIGVMGVSLPPQFLVSASQITVLQLVVLVLVGLFVVIGVGLLVSNRITKPLLRIVNASRQVAHGNLNATVNLSTNDEMTILAQAFNHMVASMRDATKRRLREVKLRQLLKHERDMREMKSRFVSMVSHEFRTPLASILSSSEYLEHYSLRTPPDKLNKHYRRIEASVNSLIRLLDEVLLIGRAESRRLEFDPAPVDLVRLCQDVIENMRSAASPSHQLQFLCRHEANLVMADGHLIQIALGNLVSNAIKYSPAGGVIHIELTFQTTSIGIRVIDEGIGIPQADQRRLFEHFYRASNAGAIPGTGLGLYIVKTVVDLHSGSVALKSQEGIGTAFLIKIPRIDLKETQT